jgi:hypothetical protein
MTTDSLPTTTPADLLGAVKGLEAAVESLHWIHLSDDPVAMRREADECLRRINGLMAGDTATVYRLPSVTVEPTQEEADRRVGRVLRMADEVELDQRFDREARR